MENIVDNNTFDSLVRGNFYDRLFSYMNLVGLDSIRVNYSGGGDSGGVDNMEFIGKGNKKAKKTEYLNNSVTESIREICEDELAQPIYDRHGGFADGGGYSVSGVVIFDANEKTVKISGTDHYYEWSEEDEDETDKRDNDFDDDIYQQTKRNMSGDEDYLFAYLYAKDVLKNKLPEEFHNKMLIAATDDDIYAVEYVKNCK